MIYIKPIQNKSGTKPQTKPEEDSSKNVIQNNYISQASQHRVSGRISLAGFDAGKRAGEKNKTGSASGAEKKIILPLAHNIVERIKKFFRGKTTPEYETITLKYVDVNQAAASITILLMNNSRGVEFTRNISVQPLVYSRQLLVFGKKKYRDIVRKLVTEIDVPNNRLQRKVFQLRYADAAELKAKIDKLFGGSSTSGDIEKMTKSADTVITIAYPSLKQIAVLASKEKMKELEKLIQEWDSPIMLDPIYPRIYTINHADKKEIIDFLSLIFSSSSGSGDKTSSDTLKQNPVIEMYKDKISFMNIPDSNKIIADSKIAEGYALVESIIKEIDKEEFVSFDKDEAYNKMLEILKYNHQQNYYQENSGGGAQD